jgi:hypothetical protein
MYRLISLAIRALLRIILALILSTIVVSIWFAFAGPSPTISFIKILILSLVFFIITWIAEVVIAYYKVIRQPASRSIQHIVRMRRNTLTFGPGMYFMQGLMVRHAIYSDIEGLLLKLGLLLDKLAVLPTGGFGAAIRVPKLVIIGSASLLIMALQPKYGYDLLIDFNQIKDCHFSRPWKWLAYALGPITNRVIIDTSKKKYKLRFELEDFCKLRNILAGKVPVRFTEGIV